MEIFRFEYHPVGGVPHRFRIVMASDSGDIRRVRERYLEQEWHEIDAEPIDYFEFSDTGGEEPDVG